MPKYHVTKRGEIYRITKKKTAWEMITDAMAFAGLGLIGFAVVCIIAASNSY